MIKVVLTGSESTGKTVLARRLGAHFTAPVSEEFVRAFAREHGELAFNDHGPIARGQIASEDAAMAKATDLVVLDTDLVSTVVFCEHYFGQSPEWIEAEARKRAGNLYLLMRPDISWVPDGVRDRGERREEIHALFREKLSALALRFVEIGGDEDVRLDTAVAAIESLRATRVVKTD